ACRTWSRPRRSAAGTPPLPASYESSRFRAVTRITRSHRRAQPHSFGDRPVGRERVDVHGQHLDAHVIGSRVEVGPDISHDGVGVTVYGERVDERVAATVGEVGIGPTES